MKLTFTQLKNRLKKITASKTDDETDIFLKLEDISIELIKNSTVIQIIDYETGEVRQKALTADGLIPMCSTFKSIFKYK